MKNTTLAILEPELLPDSVSFTPLFQDGCGHPPETYIGTITEKYAVMRGGWHEGRVVEVAMDVYVFTDANGTQKVCLRTGNEAYNYRSPGTVMDLLLLAAANKDAVEYRLAALLILKQMKVRFERA